jgi:hypothetical protein
VRFRIIEWSRQSDFGHARAIDPFLNRVVFVLGKDIPGHVKPTVGTIIECEVQNEQHGHKWRRWRATNIKVIK